MSSNQKDEYLIGQTGNLDELETKSKHKKISC